VIALYVGYALFKSDIAAVALFSAAGSVAYAGLILWVIWRARRRSLDKLEVR